MKEKEESILIILIIMILSFISLIKYIHYQDKEIRDLNKQVETMLQGNSEDVLQTFQ
jgi:signal transduction histidine kinase